MNTFAILDRKRFPTSLINGCIRLRAPDGEISPAFYHFSVGRHIIDQHPYCQGVVYLLPKATFTAEPPIPFGELAVHTAQLASLVPVAPLARLLVDPEDFPFLTQMRTHDDERLAEYAAAIQAGLPWPD